MTDAYTFCIDHSTILFIWITVSHSLSIGLYELVYMIASVCVRVCVCVWCVCRYKVEEGGCV